MAVPHTTSPVPSPIKDVGFSPQLRQTIVVTTLGAFMTFLDSTIVNVALRTFTVELAAPLATIQWVVTAYLLAMAAVLPASGWVATRFGARRVYVLSMAVFTGASVACGLAASPEMLIGFRAVQGAAGGLLMPVATIITMRSVAPELMAKVMAVSGVPMIMAP